MYKCLATITGTVAILAAAMLVSGSAEAHGGRVPSLHPVHVSQAQPVHTSRVARRHDYGITEYSSSSAPASTKTSSPKR